MGLWLLDARPTPSSSAGARPSGSSPPPAHAVYDGSALQVVYRDMNAACHHATVDFDGAAELFGRIVLGLPPETPLC